MAEKLEQKTEEPKRKSKKKILGWTLAGVLGLATVGVTGGIMYINHEMDEAMRAHRGFYELKKQFKDDFIEHIVYPLVVGDYSQEREKETSTNSNERDYSPKDN